MKFLASFFLLSISGSRSAVNLDYLSHLRSKIVLPLVTDGMGGVPKALEAMHDYSLLREDLDSILELALWPGHKDPMNMVESKVDITGIMNFCFNKFLID